MIRQQADVNLYRVCFPVVKREHQCISLVNACRFAFISQALTNSRSSFPRIQGLTIRDILPIQAVPFIDSYTLFHHRRSSRFSFHAIEYGEFSGLEIHHAVPLSIFQ